MNCPLCKTGVLEPSTHANLFERGKTVLLVRDVPALVCNQCGDAYYDSEVTERCRLMLNEAVTRKDEIVVTAFRPPRRMRKRSTTTSDAEPTR